MNIIPFDNYFTFMDHTFNYTLDESKHPYESLINGKAIQTDLGIFEFHLGMTVNGTKYTNDHEFFKAIFKNWA